MTESPMPGHCTIRPRVLRAILAGNVDDLEEEARRRAMAGSDSCW